MVTTAGTTEKRKLAAMLFRPALVTACVSLLLLGGAAPAEVAIVNRATAAIVEIYISAADDTSWGDDRLGQAQVDAGGTWRTGGLPAGACNVDVRVVYADGRTEEKHALDVCRTHDVAFDASAAASPQNRSIHHVTIENHGTRTIVAAFLSAPTSDDWGEDRLKKPLGPGSTAGVDQAGGCIADLRVVYDNRGAEERRRIDICRNQSVSLKPGWTTSDELMPPDDATAGVRPDHRT